MLEKERGGLMRDHISYEGVLVGPDNEFKVLLGGEPCYPVETQPEVRKRGRRKMVQLGFKQVWVDLDRRFRPEEIGKAILSVAGDLEHRVTGYGVETILTKEKLDLSHLEIKSRYHKFQFHISKYLFPMMTVNVETYQYRRSSFSFWLGLGHGFTSMDLVEEYMGRVAGKLGATADWFTT